MRPPMSTKLKPHPLCRCCESEPGILGDPNLGPVCPECYASLTVIRITLEKIGPLVGFGACSNDVNQQ